MATDMKPNMKSALLAAIDYYYNLIENDQSDFKCDKDGKWKERTDPDGTGGEAETGNEGDRDAPRNAIGNNGGGGGDGDGGNRNRRTGQNGDEEKIPVGQLEVQDGARC